MAQNSSYFNFKGKVAIVTGGSTGIGRATSLAFARHGARVVIGDVNPEGRKIVETIEREGGTALFVETDVRNARQVEGLVTTAVETYGGLHFAFNNAGILPAAALLADVDEAASDQVVAVATQRRHESTRLSLREVRAVARIRRGLCGSHFCFPESRKTAHKSSD